MRKYGSGTPIVVDMDGDPEPIQRTASHPLTVTDINAIETEDGPPVLEPEE